MGSDNKSPRLINSPPPVEDSRLVDGPRPAVSPQFPFIDELDEEQRAAAVVSRDAVVSAGAGSGKTRVLTARYGWLVMTGRCRIEEILTITFTNKAANEMYSRIYMLLSKYAAVNEYAREAVEQFHKARICTLDSLCAAIARTVCLRFGISPDFKSDDIQVKDLARSLALRFVMDKRDNPALQRLIAEKKMRVTANELFVEPFLHHSPVSRPLDFGDFEKIQREEIKKNWENYTGLAAECVDRVRETRNRIPLGTALYDHLAAVFPLETPAPGIEPLLRAGEQAEAPRNELASYFRFLAALQDIDSRKIGDKTEASAVIRENIGKLKTDYYEFLEALANHALQWDIVTAVFPLLEEYQALLNRKKREAGILTFNDIAHLAVDGLRLYPQIRQVYRDSLKMIMIDEFQDNNSLQRDLIDLLSDPAQVFYVGDEKQSIYRFRGADVSVFRSLADQAACALSLGRSYRSQSMLIRSFNLIFGGYHNAEDPSGIGVFPNDETKKKQTADYEVSYRWIKSKNEGKTKEFSDPEKKRLHFAFFDAGRLEDSDDTLSAADHEAVHIARTIKTMVNNGAALYDKNKKEERPCVYGDFAVLQRSYICQHALERAFKIFGIPFSADKPGGLFTDAPVNDLWALLKLLVYPGDGIAYAALLRSPFVRLSEDAFTLCMLKKGKVFDEALDGELPPGDRERYAEGRRRYRELLDHARDLSPCSLLTKLWYDYGYRYEALWSSSSQVYLDLYDLFFELARTVEDRGKTLVDFLDYLSDLAAKKEKTDDSALPDEAGSGVRFLSIHRSKGLEFPVVFVYGCGHREHHGLDHGLALYSRSWGISLHLPQAEELPLFGGDYFFLLEREDHKKKTEAELRRLLYVAMTRAESELYVTGVIPKQSSTEQAQLNPGTFGSYEEFIVERYEQYRSRRDLASTSFLRILPKLELDNSLYSVEPIYNFDYGVIRNLAGRLGGGTDDGSLVMEEAALMMGQEYAAIPGFPPHHHIPGIIAAGSLKIPGAETEPSGPESRRPVVEVNAGAEPAVHVPARAKAAGTPAQGEFDFAEPEALPRAGTIPGLSPDSGEREFGDLSAEDFGSIVHGFIESRFNGQAPRIPPRFAALIGDGKKAVEEAASFMAEGFFGSALGRKALAASFLRTEYPVLTAVDWGEGKEKALIVSGRIDLVFEYGGVFYVVDFKTDRDENITRHIGQLAVYKRAVEDIFGKPAECRLFYLRHGREADPRREIAGAGPEELARLLRKAQLTQF
jgi:ATP-dependent helicase/nuclease subunit A